MQVQIVQFGNSQPLDVPEGTTLAQALTEAGIDPEATIRFRGETIDGEERNIVALSGGDTIVAAPPEVSHG